MRPAAFALLLAMLWTGTVTAQEMRPAPTTAEELTLARLRPGRDKLARAIALYGKSYSTDPNTPDLPLWVDAQKQLYLRLELREDRTIEAVTVASFGPEPAVKTKLPATADSTGRGLRLGDSLEKARRLYGPPYFSGPSTEGGRELTLLVHKFSAEKEQPQILETSFDPVSGRLVKITLSFPYY